MRFTYQFFVKLFFNFIYRGRSIFSQLATFICIATFGTLLTALIAGALLYLFDAFNIKFEFSFITPKFMAQFISVGLVTFYSFIGHKYLSFNEGIIHRCKRALERRRNA